MRLTFDNWKWGFRDWTAEANELARRAWNARQAEIDALEQEKADLEGIDKACDAANEHVILLQDDLTRAIDRIAALEEGLRRWKCPACGGKQQYTGYSANAPEGQVCRKCVDTEGLHPVAFSVLSPPPATAGPSAEPDVKS